MCIFMYPDMKSQMDDVSNMFSGMGGFTAAFGMDRIDFSSIMGFYGIECGSIIAIGGAFYAGISGVSILSKEEHIHTAEFLFSHPLSRKSIIAQKFAACITQIIVLNVFCFALSTVSFVIIGEEIAWDQYSLFHIAQLLSQIEIASVCFGVSAFLRHGGIGIGVGIAAVFYFLNIFENISDKVSALRYLTPFSYTDAADIFTQNSLDAGLIAVGMILAAAGVITAFIKYSSKDLSV
ncbi:MAG: ABC transporter permease subunit [Oscillospiraceae bacterium]|nr:ABC transporter permease subunit [Oscillospiraceae bacterium]